MNAVTDKELDAFYGVPASEAEIAEAVIRHRRAFDADDLQTAAIENADAIFAALADSDFCEVGRIINEARKQMIADRASMAIYNRVGVVKASEVDA